MFSNEIKTRLMRAVFAGALVAGLGAGAALAAPAVVVKSSSGEYPVGSKVDDAKTITLASGDSITVLTSKGTRTMKGPGTFKVGAQPKSNRARFANLTRTRAASRTATGAVRSAATETDARPLSPNLYYVDVGRSGTMCLNSLEQVRLWRPFNTGIETYTVADSSGEAAVDVTFDDGESVAPLDPALLVISEGASYTVSGPEGAEPSTVTFVSLGARYRAADQLATALVDKGCMGQLELMGEKLGG
ncbi:MAG: hypothetical protein HRT64_06430 [Erythrobacter sp.]|nr:hypothetical protein [Erythrobacter sp.]